MFVLLKRTGPEPDQNLQLEFLNPEPSGLCWTGLRRVSWFRQLQCLCSVGGPVQQTGPRSGAAPSPDPVNRVRWTVGSGPGRSWCVEEPLLDSRTGLVLLLNRTLVFCWSSDVWNRQNRFPGPLRTQNPEQNQHLQTCCSASVYFCVLLCTCVHVCTCVSVCTSM